MIPYLELFSVQCCGDEWMEGGRPWMTADIGTVGGALT